MMYSLRLPEENSETKEAAMFGHIFKYRLKSLEKEEIFWSALFPILLCTCFAIAFSGINDKTNIFHSIPVAVVYEKENPSFELTLDSVSKSDEQGEPFLIVTESSADDADTMLEEDKVDAVIIVNDSVSMKVKKSELNQTAVQNFLNQYIQKSAIINDTAQNNPEKLKDTISALFSEAEFVKQEKLTDAPYDDMLTYFFALIAMAALFSGFLGMSCGRRLKADTSPVGMRKCLAPAKRWQFITAEFLATYFIHMVSMVILLLYMKFILKIEMGNQLGYILLTCAAGSLLGISVGMFIASFPKMKEAAGVSIFLGFSLGSSFLAGLMVSGIKISIQHNAPIISRINPATLIADSLYSLLVYDTHTRYFTNLITLTIMAVVFCVLSILMTRRKSYASL